MLGSTHACQPPISYQCPLASPPNLSRMLFNHFSTFAISYFRILSQIRKYKNVTKQKYEIASNFGPYFHNNEILHSNNCIILLLMITIQINEIAISYFRIFAFFQLYENMKLQMYKNTKFRPILGRIFVILTFIL